MVKYIYEKYNTTKSYRLTWQTHIGNYFTDDLIGKSTYSFNPSTGALVFAGGFTNLTPGASGYVYTDTTPEGQLAPANTIYRQYWKDEYSYGYDTSFVLTDYAKGAIIGQVIAEDGTYPANGAHADEFWYIRKIVATAPVLVAPNGGEFIADVFTVSWTVPQTGLKYRIELSRDNGSTWSTIVTATGVDATSHVYDFSNVVETWLAKIRITGLSGSLYTLSDESTGVFTISQSTPPSEPTNLAPKGVPVDRTKSNIFSWKHMSPNPSDIQSKADLRWRVQGDATWNDVVSNGSDQNYIFAPSTFTSNQIEWQVRTYGQTGLVSPWSQFAIFTASDPTNVPTIVQPGATVAVSRPVIEWTGGAQQSYQIVIKDGLNSIVWDTGEVASNVKARTVGVDLINGASYTINVRIKDSGGLFSSFVAKTITVSYTPPAKSSVTAYEAEGYIALSIDDDAPTGTEPVVTSHEVWKRIDGVWTRIATGVNTVFNDYHVKSGVTYEYYVKAIGENGTTSNSDVVTQYTTFRGSWIHTLQDAEATLQYFRYNGVGYEDTYEPESATLKFAGRTRPVVHFGSYADYSLTVTIQSVEGMSDMNVLRGFVRNREAIVYRDSEGNLIVGYLLSLVTAKEYRVSSATITIVETDFTEGV